MQESTGRTTLLQKLFKKPVLWTILVVFTLSILLSYLNLFLQFYLLEYALGLDEKVSRIIGSLLLAGLYLLILLWAGKSSVPALKTTQNKDSFAIALILLLPGLVYVGVFAIDIVVALSKGAQIPGIAIATCASNALVPSIGEEVALRVLILPCLLFFWKDRANGIMLAVIVSGFIFGAVHLVGLTSGAPLITILIQVFQTAAFGFFIGAAYVRTRNIWAPILMHWAIDFAGMLTLNTQEQFASVYNNLGSLVVVIVLIVTFVAAGACMLRKKHHEEIRSLWDLPDPRPAAHAKK